METATSDEKMSKEEPEQQSEDQAEEPIKGLPDSVLVSSVLLNGAIILLC